MDNSKCSSDDILLFWSGELSPEKKDCTKAHLEHCSDCSNLLKNLSDIQAKVGELPVVSPLNGSVGEMGPGPALFSRRKHLFFSRLKHLGLKILKSGVRGWAVPVVAAAAVIIFICISSDSEHGLNDRNLSVENLVDRSIWEDLGKLRKRMCLLKKRMGTLKFLSGQIRPQFVAGIWAPTDQELLKIRKRIMIMYAVDKDWL